MHGRHTPIQRQTEGNVPLHTQKEEKSHTHTNGCTHTHTYPNSNSWAECHYGFGCQWRASSMNGSDQRNAALISPICPWPYIYIMFQHSLSKGPRNLGQHWGKCNWGQAEQQGSDAEWRIDGFYGDLSIFFFFFQKVYLADTCFICTQSGSTAKEPQFSWHRGERWREVKTL